MYMYIYIYTAYVQIEEKKERNWRGGLQKGAPLFSIFDVLVVVTAAGSTAPGSLCLRPEEGS